MPLAAQEERTFFTTSVTYERRLILQSDRLCRLLLDVFRENRAKARFQMREFVIMPNHFHAILTPAPEVSPEKVRRGGQFIKGGFSFRAKKDMNFNFEIWEKGSKEHRIKDAEDYQAHVEYIWNNPVRAKLVSRAEDFPVFFGQAAERSRCSSRVAESDLLQDFARARRVGPALKRKSNMGARMPRALKGLAPSHQWEGFHPAAAPLP